jgi:Flp pilus assembly protein TadD
MKPIYIALPLLCSLPALQACISLQPKQEFYGMKPVYSIQHGGGNARDYYQLGKYFQAQNRLDQAADAYNKALLLDSNHLEAHNALGAIYSMQGKFEQAIVSFNTVIERSPQAAHLYNNLGYTYFLQQKLPEAIESYEKALALDPSHERSLNNLAQAYTQNGNQDKAQEVLARVDALKGKTTAVPTLASAQPVTIPAPSVPATVVAAAPAQAPEPLSKTVPPAQPAFVVKPSPMQNLEKIALADRAALLAPAPAIVSAQLVAVPAKAEVATQIQPISVAANVAPKIAQTSVAVETKVDVAATASVVAAQIVSAQPAAEKSPVPALSAPQAPTGYSVIAELQTELKPLPIDRNLLALATINHPAMKTTKPETAPSPVQAVAKAVQAENKNAFEKITESALKELAPNSVKLKAAKDLVAGIFRGVETAFSDLIKGKPFRLEIANGNGVSGLAKKVSDVIANNGVPVAQITNHKNYQQPQTVVQYRNGYEMQATALSKGLRNKPQLVQTANLRANTDVRLVLGRDVKTQTALFETELHGVKLAIGKDQSAKIE